MPGRKPVDAFRAFRDPMQQSLSCVSSTAVFVASHNAAKPGGVHSIKAPPGAGYVALQGGQRLHLSAAMEYEIVEDERPDRGPWKVRTTKYIYHVVSDDHTEVILFHWHPEVPGPRGPHLHVGRSQLSSSAVMSAHGHVPTGRVSFEAVLAHLISDYGVVPARADWEEILAVNNRKFEQWRTWPAPSGPSGAGT